MSGNFRDFANKKKYVKVWFRSRGDLAHQGLLRCHAVFRYFFAGDELVQEVADVLVSFRFFLLEIWIIRKKFVTLRRERQSRPLAFAEKILKSLHWYVS